MEGSDKLRKIKLQLNKEEQNNFFKYTLMIAEDIITDIENFSQQLHIIPDEFIETILKLRLWDIKQDIERGEYIFIADYLNLWKVIKEKVYKEISSEDKSKDYRKRKKIVVKIHKKIALAINNFCELIYWEPEQFILKALDYWVKEFKNKIESYDLNFIKQFIDFSKAFKLIKKALKDA